MIKENSEKSNFIFLMNHFVFIVGAKPVTKVGEIPVVVNDPYNLVSRQHCKLIFKNGFFFLEDTNSRNGTFVNGKKIFSPIKVDLDDEIVLGGKYKFSLDNPVIQKTFAGDFSQESEQLISDNNEDNNKKFHSKSAYHELPSYENIISIIALIIHLGTLSLITEFIDSDIIAGLLTTSIITYFIGLRFMYRNIKINKLNFLLEILTIIFMFSFFLIALFLYIIKVIKSHPEKIYTISGNDMNEGFVLLIILILMLEVLYVIFDMGLIYYKNKFNSYLLILFSVSNLFFHLLIIGIFGSGLYFYANQIIPDINVDFIRLSDKLITLTYYLSMVILGGFYIEQLMLRKKK